MPCDTPPPPPNLENMDEIDEDVDDLVYEFVDESDLLNYTEDDFADHSIVTFKGHKAAVFCCNFNRTGKYAVSGGQDDTAFVWETATGSTKFECLGHTDSVISASFSSDSAYVATADMLGLAQVWNADTGEKVWSFECGAEILWMEWLHKSNELIAGTRDGNCWKWSIPDGQMCVFQTNGVGSSAGCVSFNDEEVAVGYLDGSIKFWNVSDTSVAGSLTGSSAHQLSVTTIKYHPDNNLVLTGSEDGSAKLIKTSNFKVLWSINCCDANHDHEGVSVECVGFFPSQSLLATCTDCGLLSVWDISSQTKRSTCELDGAVVKLICDESCPVVYICTAFGEIESYDMRMGIKVRGWEGHKAGVLDINLSPDRKKILSASDDNTCKIFEC